MRKLFIAEFSEEIQGFIDHCNAHSLDPAEFQIIALQPEVKVRCKEKGLEYTDTLPFFNTASHKRALLKSHELTTIMAKELVFPGPGTEQRVLLDTFIFYSRFYINNYLWIIEILKGISEKYGEAEMEIYVYRRAVKGGESDPQRDGYLLKRDRFLDPLVEKYCRSEKNRLNARVIAQAQEGAVEKKQPRDDWKKRFIKKVARHLFYLRLKTLSTKKTVFIAAPSYNLDRLSRDIQARYPGVAAVAPLPMPSHLPARNYLRLCLKEMKTRLTRKKPGNSLIAVPVDLFTPDSSKEKNMDPNRIREAYKIFAAAHHQQFIHEGCTFWEEFDEKVERDLMETLEWLISGAGSRKRFLEILKPRLVMSPVSTAEYQSWAEVSGRLGIPALVIPQKTLVKPSNETAGIEEYYIGRAQVTESFANAAAQSPLVSDYLQWAGYKGNIIETGNLIFSRYTPEKREEDRARFYKEIGAKKKIIVWAPSMKTRKSRRFYVLESIDELLSAMEDVFQVVARLSDVHLIFRIHPGEAIGKAEIYTLLEVPGNVTVSDRGTFEEVLSLADLVISYSSTAAQEALINLIPVLSYDKWNRYNHLDADIVRETEPVRAAATYYIGNKKYLAAGIRRILDEHTGREVSAELFKDYRFFENKTGNFLEFVGGCLSSPVGNSNS